MCSILAAWSCQETRDVLQIRICEMKPFIPLLFLMITFAPLIIVIPPQLQVEADLRVFAVVVGLMCGAPALYLLCFAHVVVIDMNAPHNRVTRITKYWWQSPSKYREISRYQLSEIRAVRLGSRGSSESLDSLKVPNGPNQTLILVELDGGEVIPFSEFVYSTPGDLLDMQRRILDFLDRADVVTMHTFS